LKTAGQPLDSVHRASRARAPTLALFAVTLALFCVAAARCATPRPEPKPAKPGLSDDDLDDLQVLFEKVGAEFLHGNAKGMKALLAESRERDSIVNTLTREFQEARYVDFQAERPLPDDSVSESRYSVDVTIRVKLLYLDDARPPEDRKPIENSTFQSFIVERGPHGGFRIVNSSFFDNMGRRSGGTRLFVHVLGAVIVLCALLAFWVWMASEAWWIRPRSTLWRVAMIVPPLGPLIFFFFRYLPGKWKTRNQ
jgi:hypothetical protein